MFSILFVGLFLPAVCEALPKLPNARYLGMGYNVITGNPDSDSSDPGFTYGVLRFTWANNNTTSDQRYLVPDDVQALQTKSCSFRSEASTEFGARSYRDVLSGDVHVKAGSGFALWGARFTGSGGYKKVSQGTTQYRRFYTSAKGKCIQYQLAVNYVYVPITVTREFERAVGALPLSWNDNAYHSFIDTYGTHFTSRVIMGAKMVILSEFDESALSEMEAEGVNVQTAAQLSYIRFSTNVSSETQEQRQERETFERLRRSYTTSYLGSPPPSDGRWETWAKSAGDSPYPVKYRLAPITSIFTPRFFNYMSSHELNTRRCLLTAAYLTYCIRKPGCRIPPPDRTPTRLKKVDSKFIGSVTVSCPPRYNLLSCGILYVRLEGYFDRGRMAIPISINECWCYDTAGADCVAWCTSAPVNFIIRKSVEGITPTVSCPTGYKVL